MRKIPPRIIALALSAALASAACTRDGDGGDAPADVQDPVVAAPGAAAEADADADDSAAADPIQPQHRDLVRFGAGMYVAAEFCEMDYDDAERRRLLAQQKDAMVADGRMSAAQFDAAFEAGVREVRQSFGRASPDEREKACSDLQRLRQMSPAG